jgi:hypothetical protein
MLTVSLQAKPVSLSPTSQTDGAQVSAGAFLNSTAFANTTDSTRTMLSRVFDSNQNLQSTFVGDYYAAMSAKANKGISSENGQHLALFQTIMSNRSAFPIAGFKIKTELPGGGL